MFAPLSPSRNLLSPHARAKTVEVKDVKRLFKRFKNIDRNHRGFVSRGDVLHLPEFAMNPLRGRLLDLFPAGDGGTINFRQFCQGLALFHPHAPLHDKFQCLLSLSRCAAPCLIYLSHAFPVLFRLYDVDGDGTVSKADVEALLRIVGGKYVDEEKLHEYSESALFGKDSVTFEEFCAVRATRSIGFFPSLIYTFASSNTSG